MEFEEVKQEYDRLAQQSITTMVDHVAGDIVRSEFSVSPLYDIPLYSYQRIGMKKGRLLKSPKDKSDTIEYCFDKNNRIILIKKWTEFNNFNGQFFFYPDPTATQPARSVHYSDDDELYNVTYYFYQDHHIQSSISVGLYGCRKEFYHYGPDGLLTTIKTQQFETDFTYINELTQEFSHDPNGNLTEIKKIYDNDEDVVYRKK